MPCANIQAKIRIKIKIKLATDEGNSQNEIWTLNKRRNEDSCTKLALSVSWTHDLIADGLNSWPDMCIYILYIYIPKWPFLYNIYILFIMNNIYKIHIFIKNAKVSVHLSFYWSSPLVWCSGPHSCFLRNLSGEFSDLKLSRNVKVMFIFKIKVVC